MGLLLRDEAAPVDSMQPWKHRFRTPSHDTSHTDEEEAGPLLLDLAASCLEGRIH